MSITQDCIVNMFVCIRQGESPSSIIDLVFEPSLINDSSANTLHASTEEACEHRLAAFVINGRLQFKHAPATNKSDNKTKEP